MIILEKEYNNFTFLIGERSIDIFNHFGVSHMHGLNRFDAEKYEDTKEDAYICGLCNFHPRDLQLKRPSDKKPFVFMNSIRFQGDFTDLTSLMHEVSHLSFMLHDWDIEKEEEIITLAEQITNDLYREHYLKC